MRKKHRRSLLSFLLIMGILFTTVSFPEYASAEGGTDKTSAFKDNATVQLTQEGRAVTDEIDMSKDIKVDIKFNAVFNNAYDEAHRIVKGDYVLFNLGDKFKFTGDDAALTEKISPIIDAETNLKICDVIFTRDASTGNITAKFDFSNTDDDVFSKDSANIGASLKIKADSKFFDWETTTEKIINIFGKEYKVGKLDVKIKVTKKGKLDPKNSKIDWTINIERYIDGTNPVKYLSLEGFEVSDSLSTRASSGLDGVSEGQYITGTYKINGKSVNDTDIDLRNDKYSKYTIKDEDLNSENKGKATITLSSTVNFGKEGNWWGQRIYENRVYVKKLGYTQAGSYFYEDGGAEDELDTTPIARKYGNMDVAARKITWTIAFNEQEYDLGDVVISDDLAKDTTGRIPQVFKNAYFQKWDKDKVNKYGSKGDWSDEKTPVIPEVAGITHKFNIPNVNEKHQLTIETEFAQDNYLLDFNNEAFLWWNEKPEKKVKITASVHMSPQGGSKVYGSISKKANYKALIASESYYIYEIGDYVSSTPEWTVTANKESVTAPGDYYMYDAFIFDQNVKLDADTLKDSSGVSLRKVGDNSVTSLAGGLALDKAVPKIEKYQKLMNVDNPVIDATPGVTNAVYEIVKDGKVIGHVLELKLVTGQDNFAKFKSKIVDDNALMNQEKYAKSISNYLVLAKDGHVVLTESARYAYNGKLLSKQVLSTTAARKFLTDYDANATNSDVFDASQRMPEMRTLNNSTKAFDKKTKSIIYRISLNAAQTRDVEGDLGKFVFKDKLEDRLKLVPIKDDKYFLVYRGTPATELKREDKVVMADEGAPMTDAELAADNISYRITENDQNIKNGFEFDIEKLTGTYVVFLKAEQISEVTENDVISLYNESSLKRTVSGKTIYSGASARYDGRFLWKDFDGDRVEMDKNGFIKWAVYYKPYKVYNDNNATKLRIEDTMQGNIVLRKEKGTDKLLFEGDNYKIWKGEFDENDKFINPVEITENLDKIFTYDTATGKMSIHIPDNDSTYKISYVTDFSENAKRGDYLNNSVALIEGTTQRGRSSGLYFNIISDTFGRLRDKTYHRLEIVKANAAGDNLKDAEFNLKRLAVGGMLAEDFGNHKTGLDGKIKFTNLTGGEYELTEVKAPEGYKKSETPYRLKVKELEKGFKVELIGDYAGKANLEQNTLTIINDPKENPPNNTKPNPNPLNPPNDTPKPPTPPTTPTTPTTPNVPRYPRNNPPNPNDPNSPPTITIIDENGVPLGNYKKHPKPDGTFEYIIDEEVPLANLLPKTGDDFAHFYYMGGLTFMISGMALALDSLRRKKAKRSTAKDA